MNGWQILFFTAALCFALIGLRVLGSFTVNRREVARYFVAALVAMFLVALTACATTKGITQDRIVEKDIPVAVQPIKPADIPAPPPPLGKRPPSAQQAADAAFAAHCRDVAFIIRAVPLLLLSAGLPPVQAPAYPECEKH